MYKGKKKWWNPFNLDNLKTKKTPISTDKKKKKKKKKNLLFTRKYGIFYDILQKI